MSKAFVSVIIPTYNRENDLLETLQNILKNTYPFFEVLVIDQTQKHSEDFLHKFNNIKNDQRVFYLKQKKPSLPKARNFGIKKAKGDIILFIDDDVMIKKNFIASHVEAYEKYAISGVAGKVITQGKKPNIDEKHISFGLKAYCMASFTGNTIFFCETARGCNMSFKKDVLEKLGGFDEHFIGNAIREESDLCLRIQESGGKILFYPKAELIHKEAIDGGCRDEDILSKRFSQESLYQNEFYFFCKHFSLINFPFFFSIIYGYYLFADIVKRRITFNEYLYRHRVLIKGFMKGYQLYKRTL